MNTRDEQWRVDLRAKIKAKDRTNLTRVHMPELDPEYRSHIRNEEVNLGLTPAQAMAEAQRCLDCVNPTCMEGCPVSIKIPDFIKFIESKNDPNVIIDIYNYDNAHGFKNNCIMINYLFIVNLTNNFEVAIEDAVLHLNEDAEISYVYKGEELFDNKYEVYL